MSSRRPRSFFTPRPLKKKDPRACSTSPALCPPVDATYIVPTCHPARPRTHISSPPTADTAAVYRNEAEVGQAVTAAVEDGVIRSRSEVHITTKLTPKAHVSLEAAEAELQGCLARLNVGAGVDTVLIHWPGTGGRPREDADNAQRRLVTWRMLLAAQSHGQAAALGVSNYTVAHLSEIEAAGLPLPSVNQVELHPRLQQHELRRWCAERHVAVQAYSPLGCGALLADATVCHVAKKHGVEVRGRGLSGMRRHAVCAPLGASLVSVLLPLCSIPTPDLS